MERGGRGGRGRRVEIELSSGRRGRKPSMWWRRSRENIRRGEREDEKKKIDLG